MTVTFRALLPCAGTLRVGLVAIGLYGALHAAGAASAAPAPDGALAPALAAMDREFRLAPDQPVDPSLSAAVMPMLDRARLRVHRVAADWYGEEKRLHPQVSADEQAAAVWNRFINEMALWQLDSAGAEHDRRQQRALSRVPGCQGIAAAGSILGRLVQVWQQVPIDERTAYLASEEALLERWGDARPRAPEMPVRSTDREAWAAIDDFAAGKGSLALPLPTLLSWRVLQDGKDPIDRQDAENLCVLRAWWLGVALQPGQAGLSEDDWRAYRFASMPKAAGWWRSDGTEVAQASGYPTAARKARVEGAVTLAVTRDGQGRVLRATVAGRELRVPGIREQRPVAFETLLDDAAIARALALPPRVPTAQQVAAGGAAGRIILEFKLE